MGYKGTVVSLSSCKIQLKEQAGLVTLGPFGLLFIGKRNAKTRNQTISLTRPFWPVQSYLDLLCRGWLLVNSEQLHISFFLFSKGGKKYLMDP